MEKSRAEIAIDGLSNYVNGCSHDHKELVELFSVEHRTLQQSMLRAMLHLIESMADESFRTDGRNEQSKALCKQLLSGFDTQVHESQRGFKPSEFLGYI